MTARWVSEFGGFLGLRASDFVGKEGITEADMADYRLPEDMDFAEAHFLGQYLPWNSHRNAEVAVKKGMKQLIPSPANWWIHENLDNAQTGLHDHLMYRKFGFGRLTAQISVDIRQGRITRDMAAYIVRARDGLFPQRYAGVSIESVLAGIGMTKEELDTALEKHTNWEIFTDDVEAPRYPAPASPKWWARQKPTVQRNKKSGGNTPGNSDLRASPS